MRFLCLHGSGTTGDILKIQLGSLRQKLGEENHTFDYWDGPFASKAGPGVGPFFDPPYYSWWKTPSEPEVRTASERLRKLLKEQEEPYDVLIGFSQGVALISSVVLLCQNEYPDDPLPFKGALQFCGGVPSAFLENYMEVSAEAKDCIVSMNDELSEASMRNAKKVEEMLESGKRQEMWDHPTSLWNGTEVIVRDPWKLPPLDENDVFGLDVSNIPSKAMMTIPTVVVYGHKDPMSGFHVQLALLCRPENRLIYDHRGGHEIPRTLKVLNDLASAVGWLESKIGERE